MTFTVPKWAHDEQSYDTNGYSFGHSDLFEDLTSILLRYVLGFIKGRLLAVMLVSVVARLKKRFALKH